MRLTEDIKTIFRKDWKLFLLTNVLYFGTIGLGALIALASPDLQLSLIGAAGETFGSGGLLSEVGAAYLSGNVLAAAVLTFLVNLFLGTIVQIILPSLVLPFWALPFGMFRALLWGIMLVVPVPGVLPLSTLLPHYLTLLLEGEAYVVAIFACTRGLIALIRPRSFGTESRAQAYRQHVFDVGKLLLVVAALLAVAAVYEAVEVTYFAGAAGDASGRSNYGFYDEEFGASSSYSNLTMDVPADRPGWVTFPLGGGKITRVRATTDGTPVDILVMDSDNFTAYNSSAGGWRAYVVKPNAVNETFDFVPPRDGVYWFVIESAGDSVARVRMQVRSGK